MNISVQRSGVATQAEADALWNRASTWFSNATSGPRIGLVHLRSVKVSDIGTDGKLIGNAAVHVGLTAGATNSGQFPPQVAIVASLGTGLRGSTHRGRVYIPLPSVSLTDSMQVDEASRGNIELQFKTFLDSVNAQYAGQMGVCVASSKGFNTKVTGVRVGDVLDTMRSRRRKLKEAYTVGLPLA